MEGKIMRISRLRMGTDGNGITTLVAFADCPLHCRYCINDFCHKASEKNADIPAAIYWPGELADILAVDDIYFKMSGGGVTFGGGEPLLYAGFIAEAVRRMDPDWRVTIETSLNAPWKSVEALISVIDEWIVDIKDMDPDIYREYTGKKADPMLNNLERLIHRVPAEKILARVPHIPGYNLEEDVEHSKRILSEMGISRIDEFKYTV